MTSSNGIQVTQEIAAAVETPGVDSHGIFGYALIGFLVGIVPVALGLMWLPALRGADPRWLAAFMALTAGLLTFLALDALAEALDLQATLPGQLGGTGLVLLGVAASYLALTFVSQRLGRRGPSSDGGPARAASRSPRSSPSASGCTTSGRVSPSARRSRSASLHSAAS